MKYKLRDKKIRNLKIIDYYKKGYTMRAIAGKFHISPARVCKIINKLKNDGG